jgi:AcrR family transcriptional regulator
MSTDTRDRLISSAADLFYEHGFHAIGLDRVLNEVGVTKTTFYNHFESRDDLIIAVLQERDALETKRMLEGIEERAAGDPRSQLLAIFDLLEEWFNESSFKGCMFINAAAAFPDCNDPIHRVASGHSQHLYEVVQRLAVEAGADRPDELAHKIMVVLAGAIVTRHAALNPDAGRIARSTVELLIEHYLPPVLAGT